jgi:hypothetical protein
MERTDTKCDKPRMQTSFIHDLIPRPPEASDLRGNVSGQNIVRHSARLDVLAMNNRKRNFRSSITERLTKCVCKVARGLG